MFGLSSISTYLIAGAVAISIGFYGGYKVTSDHYKAGQVKILIENQKKFTAEVKEAQDAETALEAQKEANENLTNSINAQVAQIVTRTVYRNVCLDTDGLRLANQSLAGSSANPNTANQALPIPNATK